MKDINNNLEGLRKKIEKLSDEIRVRIARFNANREKIEHLLQTENSSNILDELSGFTKENQDILTANEKALHLQNVLINLFNTEAGKLQDLSDRISKNRSSELFNMTITGSIPLDDAHPYCNDLDFLNRLLSHFEAEESYEDCQMVYDRIQGLTAAVA